MENISALWQNSGENLHSNIFDSTILTLKLFHKLLFSKVFLNQCMKDLHSWDNCVLLQQRQLNHCSIIAPAFVCFQYFGLLDSMNINWSNYNSNERERKEIFILIGHFLPFTIFSLSRHCSIYTPLSTSISYNYSPSKITSFIINHLFPPKYFNIFSWFSHYETHTHILLTVTQSGQRQPCLITASFHCSKMLPGWR